MFQMIVIVFGLPGSGKSYFARKLAARINGDYINSDVVRKEMFRQKTYSEQEKLLVYKAMIEKVVATVKQNGSVVVDATFYKKDIRTRFIEEIKIKDPVVFIEVIADEDLIKERLKTPRTESDADFAVYQKIKEQWEPLDETHLVLHSTNDNIDDMLEIATNYLHVANDKRSNR